MEAHPRFARTPFNRDNPRSKPAVDRTIAVLSANHSVSGGSMDVPPLLVDQVRSGKVILFLGAGAACGATSPNPPYTPPSGSKLAELLAEKFLGGRAKDKPLTLVAEYSIAQSDLRTVQTYIAEILAPFQPSGTQLKLPTFRWAALITTNYDRIVERAYAENKAPLQTLVPILRNTDRVDNELRAPDAIPYIKLHGSIDLIDDARYPLILTIDQYVTHRKGREKLYSRLVEYAAEYTFVFVGYSLQDPDLRAVLLELTAPDTSRPRHYVVTLGATELDRQVWESKQITTLNGSFDEFILHLDTNIPAALRAWRSGSRKHEIETRFTSHATLTAGTLAFLEADCTYIYPGMRAEPATPSSFYKGASYGWGGILGDLDSKRELTDAVLSEAILVDTGGFGSSDRFLDGLSGSARSC
jgi:SIR2-like domain